MKKVVLFLVASLFVVSAQARESLCGYRDYFHLDDKIHPGVFIVSANHTPDIYMQVISPRSFEIRDTQQCRDGYAHVTVAYDAYNWCVLDIKDGPYMMHPSINASCNGMRYKGISYDGFNSYSYTINLD
ncbi:hypothetical protein [Legionella hackeliae]|uniref:Uncharacterized protein n=1 Tax=Legionella hackeliae TaxID=449 RepID=A0A0A8UNY5_LEGHA|nr:hypothetical protein [Legionella hackeliae]KTD12903.1 hypothetical protein Lhac_1774 [Legionella hackeliae]CEK09211.1 conserved exported protein of unknown function [Legionella hackeliae]STX49119.1 Uncharacterised protein [Legionella hackeliae]